MIVGITGTRNGAPEVQLAALSQLIWKLKPDTLLHGACLGVDEQAAKIAFQLGCRIVAYPGRGARDTGDERPDRSAVAMSLSTAVMTELTHFARNREIVEACDLLIAVPPCSPLPLHGGTSYTVKYARRVDRHVQIVWPDGGVT